MIPSSIYLLTLIGSVIAQECSSSHYTCSASAPCCSIHGYCGNGWDYCSKDKCVLGCHLGEGGGGAADTGSWSGGQSYGSGVAMEYSQLERMTDRRVYARCKNPKHAALTFDDGVSEHTDRLLDILDEMKVKATFFVMGSTICKHTDIAKWETNSNYYANKDVLKRMYRRGHDIASHTFSHPELSALSNQAFRNEIHETEACFEDILNVKPNFFRPSYGRISADYWDYLYKRGYSMCHWSYNTEDWVHYAYDPDRILSYVKYDIPAAGGDTAGGPIILMHDRLGPTVDLQREIIISLQEKGYKLVPMRTCIGERTFTRVRKSRTTKKS